MSISWRHAARALGLAVAAVAALALVPSLLRTPEPPPLDPDVGLTGFADAAPPAVERPGDGAPHRSDRRVRPRKREKTDGDQRREGGEDERRARNGEEKKERPRDDAEPASTPEPTAVPASSPPPSPPAAPPAPPSPVPVPAPAPIPAAAPPPPAEPAGPPPGVRQFGP